MTKQWVVVLGSLNGSPIYLGELEPRVRQGVQKLANAVRFTQHGARRVAAAYGDGAIATMPSAA